MEIGYRYILPGEVEGGSLTSEINRLLRQLSPNCCPLDASHLSLATSHSRVLTAWKGQQLVGMATLVPVFAPSGSSGFIHDVVTDVSVRGWGVGRELMKRLVEEAGLLGLKFVELTCRSDRVAANRLYQDSGFVARDTNVYRKAILQGGIVM